MQFVQIVHGNDHRRRHVFTLRSARKGRREMQYVDLYGRSDVGRININPDDASVANQRARAPMYGTRLTPSHLTIN